MVSYSIWIVVSVLIYALLPISPEMPDIAVVSDVLYWLIPVTLLVVLPAGFTMMWGAPLLSPAVTALLLMTEISVGTITAAIWADESFGFQEIAGVILITGAGLLEVLVIPISKIRLRYS